MAPTLLVLAAGSGTRYGGLKQIDPVGPSGETLLDYAVFDAIRAGFGRVAFVIRRDFEAAFREKVVARYRDRVGVDIVFQETDALPGGFHPPHGRGKPWGTAHAVWCARGAVAGGFAVINADDFYGADSYVQLAGFLSRPAPAAGPPVFAMAGFRLGNTLSGNGAVSRGVCTVEGGWLKSIVEHKGVGPGDVGPGRPFAGDEVVSMNCWAFTPALFAQLEDALREFLANRGSDPGAECYLPEAVSSMVSARRAAVRVLPTAGSWLGVTYREDRPRVTAAIKDLVDAGTYPAPLAW